MERAQLLLQTLPNTFKVSLGLFSNMYVFCISKEVPFTFSKTYWGIMCINKTHHPLRYTATCFWQTYTVLYYHPNWGILHFHYLKSSLGHLAISSPTLPKPGPGHCWPDFSPYNFPSLGSYLTTQWIVFCV